MVFCQFSLKVNLRYFDICILNTIMERNVSVSNPSIYRTCEVWIEYKLATHWRIQGGGHQGHVPGTPPPPSVQYLNVHAVLGGGKFGQNNRLAPHLYGWSPHLWKILDSPLATGNKNIFLCTSRLVITWFSCDKGQYRYNVPKQTDHSLLPSEK